jgi:hypothetical protein
MKHIGIFMARTLSAAAACLFACNCSTWSPFQAIATPAVYKFQAPLQAPAVYAVQSRNICTSTSGTAAPSSFHYWHIRPQNQHSDHDTVKDCSSLLTTAVPSFHF